MSAGESRHEDAPKKIEEWGISEERLSWMKAPESEESIALAQETEEDGDWRPETSSGEAPEGDDTCDMLLSAIGGTETARLLRGLMPAEDRRSDARAEGAKAPVFADEGKVEAPPELLEAAPAHAEAPNVAIPASAVKAEPPAHAEAPKKPIPADQSKVEIPAVLVQAAHAVKTVGTFIVQSSPQAASAPLMPPATAPHPRAAATLEAAGWGGVPHVAHSSEPEPKTEAESTPAVAASRPAAPAQDRSPKTIAPVRRGDEKSRLGAKLALTTKSMGRALWQHSVQLTNRLVTEAEAIIESTDFAALRQSSDGPPDGRADVSQNTEGKESVAPARQQPSTRLQKWLDPRRSLRIAQPPVIAYCWTADTPHPVKVADISSGGVYLLTEARWPQGGVLSMTLQRTDRSTQAPESWIVIDFIVVRFCNDGVAGAFISSTSGVSRMVPSRAENCADDKTLKRFVSQLAAAGG